MEVQELRQIKNRLAAIALPVISETDSSAMAACFLDVLFGGINPI
ncbi:hypothetical protein [Iningainema tapete]|nr:hypothetical protein [Iningainema tapete]